MLLDEVVSRLKDMEQVAQLFQIEPFELYLLGGTACLLNAYTTRATLDFDFLDQSYPAHLGRVFSMLRDFDMLEFESTFVPSDYKSRANVLPQFAYLKVFTLSPEDIIVSKLVRMAQKDYDDIDKLICIADKSLLLKLIDETLERTDLYDSKKEAVRANLQNFKEHFHV